MAVHRLPVDRRAQALIAENLAHCGVENGYAIIRARVERAAEDFPVASLDIVLLDPPYGVATADVDEVLHQLARPGWVAPGGTVVVERPKGGDPLTMPDGWGVEKERAYGDTLLVVAIA